MVLNVILAVTYEIYYLDNCRHDFYGLLITEQEVCRRLIFICNIWPEGHSKNLLKPCINEPVIKVKIIKKIVLWFLKPHPHQQQCRSNIVECYNSNDAFDKVETNRTCSICFDFVDRTKFYDKLVRHCWIFLATKSNVASTKSNVDSTLLLVCTGLEGHRDRWLSPVS